MKKIFAFLLIAGLAQTAWCDEQPMQKDGPSFKTEISIRQDSLKTDSYKKIGLFIVDTKIKNVSTIDQNIIIWTQQGDSWIPDNPMLNVDKEAAKNSPSTITLKPMQEYSGAVEVYQNSTTTKALPLAFRLGFFPKGNAPASYQADIKRDLAIIWSNPAVLKL